MGIPGGIPWLIHIHTATWFKVHCKTFFVNRYDQNMNSLSRMSYPSFLMVVRSWHNIKAHVWVQAYAAARRGSYSLRIALLFVAHARLEGEPARRLTTSSQWPYDFCLVTCRCNQLKKPVFITSLTGTGADPEFFLGKNIISRPQAWQIKMETSGRLETSSL